MGMPSTETVAMDRVGTLSPLLGRSSLAHEDAAARGCCSRVVNCRNMAGCDVATDCCWWWMNRGDEVTNGDGGGDDGR